MKCKLSDICEYRKGKVNTSNLTLKTYISTENMLPDKAGVVEANSLPSTRLVQEYKEHDTLVSNIRPYFKKIWQAKHDGGCSNDVLVFQGKANVDKDFLYYILANDDFFAYSMATSKGTKMPRGDKKSIMQYELQLFDIKIQKKIVSILKLLDKKIELNNAINNNLEQQAIAIFDNMFPNISTAEKTIGDIIIPKRGKSLLSKNAIFGSVPVVAGGLNPSTYHNTANTVAPVLSISASGANAGYISLWTMPIWSSDSSFIDSSMSNDVYFWYVLLKKRQNEIYDSQTGSAQPHIYPQHIAAMPICDLNFNKVSNYTSTVTPIFELIGHNKIEDMRLITIRDTLVPKLISGDLDVSNISL